MKAVLLVLICLCVFPTLVRADADSERSLEAAKAVNAFAAAHHRLQAGGNALTSPLSIEMNMAMVYAGAGGKTRDAMAKAFFFPADEPALHASFQSLRKSLLVRPLAGVPFEFRLANRVFYQKTLRVRPPWLELTGASYGAEAGPLDFSKRGASATRTINQWVSEQTAHKIPEIIPPGGADGASLVVVNALYFDLPWEERFTKELTQFQPFYVDASHAKRVPLMFKQHALGYARKDGFQIAALRYAGGTYQFVVFLPDAIDGLAKVENAITGELLSQCVKLEPTEVRLSFPRLRVEPPIVKLKESLTKMGAGEMFSGDADFSRMLEGPAKVSEVFHRTWLELDEDGTKAAAATATIMSKNGHPHEVPHEVVKADHPFIYMIQHIPSGTCLFLGRLTDPSPTVAATKAVKPVEQTAPEAKN